MATYLVADDDSSLWGHIFDDGRERMTRFVYDMEAHLLLAVQIATGPIDGWRDATPAELLDVSDDIDTNRAFASPADWGLDIRDEAPAWGTELVRAATAGFATICDEAARFENLVPDTPMEYEEWLEFTGLDDSFVGDLQRGIPGTRDKFDAAMRLDPPASSPKP